MKQLIPALKTIAGYLIVFLAMYLLAAFVKSSFSILNWGEAFKVSVCFLAIIFGTMAQFPIHKI